MMETQQLLKKFDTIKISYVHELKRYAHKFFKYIFFVLFYSIIFVSQQQLTIANVSKITKSRNTMIMRKTKNLQIVLLFYHFLAFVKTVVFTKV